MSSLGDPMRPDKYAAEWAQDSADISAAGGYAWMDGQLGACNQVLEIGCGSGEGTLQLAKTRKVVSLEVNPSLLKQTHQRLLANGVSVEIVLQKALWTSTAQVRLVDISVFGSAVPSALGKQNFDAIVCWLPGASPDLVAMSNGVATSKVERKHIRTYRENVHRRCYVLGKKCLREGGVVHTVDRFGLTPDLMQDAIEARVQQHAWLAGAGYTVNIADAALFPLPTVGTSEIQYHMNVQDGQVYLASSKAVRQ